MSVGRLKEFLKSWKDQSPFMPFCLRQSEVVKLSMVYRNRFEIQATILEAAGRCASKTRVMYNATVSHFQLCSYLTDLLEMGLIEYDSSVRLYRTTTKGYDFLNSFKQLNGMLEGTLQPADYSEFREENVGPDNLMAPIRESRRALNKKYQRP